MREAARVCETEDSAKKDKSYFQQRMRQAREVGMLAKHNPKPPRSTSQGRQESALPEQMIEAITSPKGDLQTERVASVSS